MSPRTSLATARGLHRIRPPHMAEVPQYVLPEYNAIGVSVLKQNPTQVFALAQEVPVAVFRHNKVLGFVLTARNFNEILERQLSLQADKSELSQLVQTAAPGLLELLAETYPDRELSPFVPHWPIFGDVGRTRGLGRTGVVTRERLELAAELAREWIEMRSGRGLDGYDYDDAEDDASDGSGQGPKICELCGAAKGGSPEAETGAAADRGAAKDDSEPPARGATLS